MTLLEKQQEFALQAAHLIIYAHSIGKPVTVGDAYRDPRLHGEMGAKKGYGASNSCHKLRLAIDLNIVKDGRLMGASEHKELHDHWLTLGGSKIIDSDSNHYSFEHNGFR